MVAEAVRFTAVAAPPYNCGAISDVKRPARAARSIAYLGIVVRVLQPSTLPHVDLAGGEQARTILPWRPLMANGLDLDPSLELFVGRPMALVTGMRSAGANVPLRCSTAFCMVLVSAQRQREHELRVRRYRQ